MSTTEDDMAIIQQALLKKRQADALLRRALEALEVLRAMSSSSLQQEAPDIATPLIADLKQHLGC